MKKALSLELEAQAHKVAEIFSNPDRQKNFNKETFVVTGIKPYSEHSASVSFLKNTGKISIAFACYNNGPWRMFFPDDSVILGMSLFTCDKAIIEEFNFNKNFVGEM